jgi:hypothetical protein
MITVILLVMLAVMPVQAGDNFAKPGTILNPYIATPRIGGGYTIRPSIPDMDDRLGKPGTWSNPTVVQPRIEGGYEVRSTIPDWEGQEDNDDE